MFFVLYRFFNVYYPIAHAIGYITGVLFGYAFNRSWTFISVIAKKKWELLLYITVYVTSLLLSVAALQIIVEYIHINPLIANIFAIGVSMVTNFLGCKYLVFDEYRINQLRKVAIYFTPAFWIIFGIKIISSWLFGSHFLTQGFLPFVNYWSTNLANPYQYFFQLHSQIFPYPAGMLGILSFPFLVLQRSIPPSWFNHLNFQLFVLRLPILAADVLLYVLLCLLLPTKQKQVLWLYFASPILFYINYFHGQLDVLPTALLFLSIVLLLKNKNWAAFGVLGLGIATKTHLLVAVPFYVIYLYRNQFSLKKITQLTALAAAVFLICNPLLFTHSFIASVFNNPEQRRLFDLAIPFGFNGLTLFVAPAALLLVLYKFAGYKKLNFDSLLLALGLCYIVLVALVPPMQGWYYWSLPFLIFFFIKYRDSKSLSIWAINGLYLLYFAFLPTSDIFESFSPTSLRISSLPTPYQWLITRGHNAPILENAIFSALEVMLIACAAWAYSVSIKTTELYQRKKQRFVLGIAGDSGVGKSTLTRLLEQVTGQSNTVILNGDDVHKWERGDEHWQQLTHLNPKANWVHQDLEHALALLKGEAVQRPSYDHTTGKFLGSATVQPNKYVVFQGLMPFVLDPMRELHDLKIYVETDDNLRVHWKLSRDTSERGHTEQEIRQQIESRKQDTEKFIAPQKNYADWIIRYLPNGSLESFSVEYLFKNSIFSEGLVEELATVPTLQVDHAYYDLSFQKLSLSGDISAPELEAIAYKLYPNLVDLVEHTPTFSNGLKGIHQLFFIHYLNDYYKNRSQRERVS